MSIAIVPAGALPQVGQAPKDVQHYMRAGTLGLPALPPLSLYIHLPWCLKKCPYCDFNSHAVREFLPEADYLAALVAEEVARRTADAAPTGEWDPDRTGLGLPLDATLLRAARLGEADAPDLLDPAQAEAALTSQSSAARRSRSGEKFC